MTAPFRAERCPCGRRWEHCPRRGEFEFGPARDAGAGRASTWREHGLRLPRAAVAFLCAFVAATPATAAHCSPGQIWRIRLDQCVGAGSALARPYVHQARFRPPAVRHVADADPPPPQPVAEPPAPPPDAQAALAEPLVLPDLEDGAPAIWRLCQAAPNLCKANER